MYSQIKGNQRIKVNIQPRCEGIQPSLAVNQRYVISQVESPINTPVKMETKERTRARRYAKIRGINQLRPQE
jgi:hypothetical protein